MNPNLVPINYTLTLDQVNLILAGLGKLPYESVVEFVNDIRAVALYALQQAEEAAKAQEAVVENGQVAE